MILISSFFRKSVFICVSYSLSFFISKTYAKDDKGSNLGAVIVISAKGNVQAIGENGDILPTKIKPGTILAQGFALQTGVGGEASIVFSNGTVASLEPSSNLRIASFSQANFATANEKLSEADKEPSSSVISLDLNAGALVVQTKKLDKSSTFNINSQTGTAGIRGTQFQLGLTPDGNTKLDVATSSVSFTPVGGNTILVAEGKGLDVSKNGLINQRAIDPAISVNINNRNSFASAISAQIPMSTIGEAKEKASSLVPAAGNENSKSDQSDSEDSNEDESSNSNESKERKAANSFIEQQNYSFRSVPGTHTGTSYIDLILGLANDEQDLAVDDSITSEFIISVEGEFLVLTFGDSEIKITKDMKISEILERLDNANFQHSEFSNELFAVSLRAFAKLQEKGYQNDKINDALRGALDFSSLFLNDVTLSESKEFIYERIQSSNDLTPGKVLNASNLVDVFGDNPYLFEVGIILAEYGALGNPSGNRNATDIAFEIFEFLGDAKGESIPNYFSLGDARNEKLISATLLGSSRNDLIDPPSDGKGEKGVLDSATKKKSSDYLFKIYRDNIYGLVGADVSLGASNDNVDFDVSNILTKSTNFESDPSDDIDGISNDKKILAFAAAKDLHIKGAVNFLNKNTSEDHALVLGAGDHVEIERKSKINYEGSNLGIGSYSSLTLNEVDIDVGGNLAIGTLSDVIINNSNFSVGRYTDRDNVYLFAENFMKIEGLNFDSRPDAQNKRFLAGRAREIYMEAITLDLKDVHFPAESEVMLRSRDGIPKFYGENYGLTNLTPGAVNFYSNSNTYGGSNITPSAFSTLPNANPNRDRKFTGYDSIGENFQTSIGTPGIKIRKFPD